MYELYNILKKYFPGVKEHTFNMQGYINNATDFVVKISISKF